MFLQLPTYRRRGARPPSTVWGPRRTARRSAALRAPIAMPTRRDLRSRMRVVRDGRATHVQEHLWSSGYDVSLTR